MTYGFRDLGEPKIRSQNDTERLETGSRESKEPTDTPWDDVDQAEFFDPEEFGVRRWDSHPSL